MVRNGKGSETSIFLWWLQLSKRQALGKAAVFNVAGSFCATQAKCTHSDGKLDDSTVTCPLHGSRFNVWTGEVLRGPATDPLKTYRVIVEGDIGRIEGDAAAVAKASSPVT
jgi:nitrite reductase/ring-hydroxylating ferredoxin subunit